MTHTFTTRGTCSRSINIEHDGEKITSISFEGGCDGNLQGISKLVVGMPLKDVASMLKGIDCKGKGTSCPDQLSQAINEILSENA